MAITQAPSKLAEKLGKRITESHLKHKDDAIDTGRVQLPPGINRGTAKLSACYIKAYTAEDAAKAKWKEGNEFFRASAVVLLPTAVNGQKCEGGVTSVVIPLCDKPAPPPPSKGKAKPFDDHWFEFQNWFKMMGVLPPAGIDPKMSDAQKAAVAAKIMVYYQAAMKLLVGDPATPTVKVKPVYVSFSTRGWTPDKTPTQPNPTEMVMEEWHGRTEYVPTTDPSLNGVHAAPAKAAAMQPEPFTEPPMGIAEVPAADEQPEPTGASEAQEPGEDVAVTVQALLDLIASDGDGEQGVAAIHQLIEMAAAVGYSKEQCEAVTAWSEVGEWIVAGVQAAAEPVTDSTPAIGAVYQFKRRDPKGNPLVGKDKKELAALQVEVTAVDAASQTVTAKTADGKVLAGIDKKPTKIKFEWLES